MGKLAAALLLFLVALPGHAQSIEGYCQDAERRILYSRAAPPGYACGSWTALDQQQTYPSAKQICPARSRHHARSQARSRSCGAARSATRAIHAERVDKRQAQGYSSPLPLVRVVRLDHAERKLFRTFP
jgi:hypothetical protein